MLPLYTAGNPEGVGVDWAQTCPGLASGGDAMAWLGRQVMATEKGGCSMRDEG